MKTNFHNINKDFALSLAFIMRFKATRKWPIYFTLNSFFIIFITPEHVLPQSAEAIIFPSLASIKILPI